MWLPIGSKVAIDHAVGRNVWSVSTEQYATFAPQNAPAKYVILYSADFERNMAASTANTTTDLTTKVFFAGRIAGIVA